MNILAVKHTCDIYKENVGSGVRNPICNLTNGKIENIPHIYNIYTHMYHIYIHTYTHIIQIIHLAIIAITGEVI